MSTTHYHDDDNGDLMLWILNDFADNAMASRKEVEDMFNDLMSSPLVKDKKSPHNENYCLWIVIQYFNWRKRREMFNA